MARDDARDHRFERALLDPERPGDRRAQGDLNRDDDAAFVERVDDPAQASKRDRAVQLAGPLQPVHRPQHAFENEADVLVYPLVGRTGNVVDRRGRREVLPAEPDINRHGHANILKSSTPQILTSSHPHIFRFSSSTVLTGASHVKFLQMYTAVAPPTGCIAATSGSRSASARR